MSLDKQEDDADEDDEDAAVDEEAAEEEVDEAEGSERDDAGLRFCTTTSTPQLPFKTPQIPSNRDHKALNRGTLGGLGNLISSWPVRCNQLPPHPAMP